MKVVAVDHVQLAMPAGREDEARAFYGGLLGLGEIPKPPVLAKRGGAWFEDGPVKVHLGVEKDFRPATKAHVALVVDGYDDLLARLRAAGVTIADAEQLDGVRRVHAFDPFGNRLELIAGDGGGDGAGDPRSGAATS